MLLLTAAFSHQRQSIFSLEFSQKPRKQTPLLWHAAATSKAAKIMYANVCRCETADLAHHSEITMLLLLKQICHIS